MSQIFLRQHQYGKCCTILVRYRFESSFVYASLFVTDMLSLRDKEKFSNHLQTCCPYGAKKSPIIFLPTCCPYGTKKNSPIICRHVALWGKKISHHFPTDMLPLTGQRNPPIITDMLLLRSKESLHLVSCILHPASGIWHLVSGI